MITPFAWMADLAPIEFVPANWRPPQKKEHRMDEDILENLRYEFDYLENHNGKFINQDGVERLAKDLTIAAKDTRSLSLKWKLEMIT